MKAPGGGCLLLALAATASAASTATNPVQVRGEHARDGLLLLNKRARATQRKQTQAGGGPWGQLIRIKGGIEQSKHAPLISEALGTGIITTTAGLLSKTDLPASVQGLAVGAVVTSLVYSLARISGAQLNPAVSATLTLLGKQSPQQTAVFVLSQVVGAVGGGFLAKGIAKTLPDPSGAVSAEDSFVDGLYSFGLVLTALQTAVAKSRAGNSFFGACCGGDRGVHRCPIFFALQLDSITLTSHATGIAIGSIVTLGAALGAGMNPAVSLGKYAASSSSAAGLLSRCAVPVIGGIAAALVFRATDLDEAGSSTGVLPGVPVDTVRKVGPLLNELVGTGLLTGSVALALGGGKLPAPIAAGLALTALAFGGGYVSGGHYNPAVSVGIHLRNKARFALSKVASYAGAQTLGALAATAAVKRFLGAGAMAGLHPLPAGGYAWQHAFAAEATFTALLVSTVLHSAQGTQLAPLAIAASLMGGLFGAGVISGGGLNPAAATALFVSNGKETAIKENLWVYVAAPLVGAALGSASVALTSPPDAGK